MIFRAIFLLIFICTSFLVQADDRDSEISKALSQQQEIKADQQTWEGQNSDQPYIVLLNEYETKINPDWSYQETYHTRIKVQKESAKELGEWPIYYNKTREEIVEIKAFVETPEGKKHAATQIQDVQAFDQTPMYDDMKVKIITLPQVNIGSVLDVSVKSKTSKKEIPNHFWDKIVYPQVPTKYARHTYIYPTAMQIVFKAFKQDYQPLMEEKDGMTKISFVFEQTQDFPGEELMPPLDEIKGGLYLSSLKDWAAVADWYRALIKKNIIDEEMIRKKTNEIIAGKTTGKDKTMAILEFMQDNFRYVALNFGDHNVEPHATTDIYKNRYGDCKDLSLLAKQMLNIAGIPADIVLMSGEYTGNPDNALPNPSLFEHVIIAAQVDGQNYFIDPQLKGFELGQHPSIYDHAHLLVVQDEGYRFDHMPILDVKDRTLDSQAQIQIKANGSAQFTVTMRLPLESSQNFRSEWASMTNEEKKRFFQSLESNFAQGGTMLSNQVKGVEQRYGPVEFLMQYESPTAFSVVNDMILVKEADHSDMPEFAAVQRQYPIFMPTNSLIRYTNTYIVPDGFKIDFVPADYDLSIDFMDINSRYTRKDNTITVITQYNTKRSMIEPKRYPEVKKFRNDVYAKNDQYIVLKQKGINAQAIDRINQ